jgi:hypothetical protein
MTPERMSLAEAVAPASLRADAGGLSPGAREAANLLGILPKVERLQQLNRGRNENAPLSDEELALRVAVLDKILGGELEVRVVTGRIDRELSWSFSSQGKFSTTYSLPTLCKAAPWVLCLVLHFCMVIRDVVPSCYYSPAA